MNLGIGNTLMVMPVTGPEVENIAFSSPFTNYGYRSPNGKLWERHRYRQKAPFNLPLAYFFRYRSIDTFSSNEPGNWSQGFTQGQLSLGSNADVYNKAYSKFKADLGSSASLSVTLAEGKQASDMLTKRFTQLVTFATQLKRLQFADAARTLGVTAPPLQKRRRVKGRQQPFEYAIWRDDGSETVEKRARRFYLKKGSSDRARNKIQPKQRGLIREDSHKAFANNYLEFHFGWTPLVQDIGSALDVLCNRLPPFKAKGKARIEKIYTDRYQDSYVVENRSHHVTCSIKIQALIRVNNPNLLLANQMGFVNPATVAWELVPYSFVVDWFVNVSDVLESMTTFVGLDLISATTTTYSTDKVVYTFRGDYGLPSGPIFKIGRFSGVYMTRSVGIPPGPTLKMRPPWDLSWRRGLAAASLLIQKMR